MPAGHRSALLLGATGLVGRHCLNLLLEASTYDPIAVIARREAGREHPRLKWVSTDFEHLSRHEELFSGSDVFCCLGTTLAKAGSPEAFQRVDHDYVLAAGRLAAEQGARQFLVVTAAGAAPESRLLYMRTKGQIEADLSELNLPALHIFRPSILLGKREERRPAEAVGVFLGRLLRPLFAGPLRKYRPITAATVAAAMLAQADRQLSGTHILTSQLMENLVN